MSGFHDLRWAVRQLINCPVFTALCLLTLALGIGANTAMFSVLHAVLLEGLPYADPARLMEVRGTQPDKKPGSVSPPDFFDLRRAGGGRRSEGDSAKLWTIVGVVENVLHDGPERPQRPTVYVPFQQSPSIYVDVVARTRGEPLAASEAVSKQVWSVDRNQPLYRMGAMTERVSEMLAERRFFSFLLLLFAGLATVLATLGVYGVTAHSVARRSREVGIRMALGAKKEEVLRTMLGQSMVPVGVGLACGLALSLVVARSMSSMLFGIGRSDPTTLGLVIAGLAAVTVLASYLPARRAASRDPVRSLRDS